MYSAVVLVAAATFSGLAVPDVIAQGMLNLRVGQICKAGNPPSYCRDARDCAGIEEAIKSGAQPAICSFKQKDPIICCTTASKRPAAERPSVTSEPTWPRPHETPETPSIPDTPPSWGGNDFHTRESKADKMCRHYAKYLYRLEPPLIPLPNQPPRNVSYCGIVATPLIVGGEDAKLREFPHMARIGYGPENNIIWLCGGSLISENFVLSAAHCTKVDEIYAEWVNLGDLDISTDKDRAEPVTIRIIQRINHPGYKGTPIYHDIALYKLQRNAPLGINIRPLCLNTRRYIQAGEKAWASGWGHQVFANFSSSSNMLQKVGLGFVANEACNSSYRPYIRKNSVIPRGINPDYMVCAGGVKGKDTCQGDSGGPLQIPLKDPYCMYAIVGVVSFGVNCGAEVPGVYTNVAHYVPWIENIVWPT